MATLKKNQILTACLLSAVSTAYAANETIQGHIGGLSNQLNRDIGDVPGNRYNGDLSFTYYKANPYELERKFDFAAMVNDQSLTQYSLMEAYVAKRGVFRSYDHIEKTGDQVKVGRQVLNWSTLDQTWGLGKLNNRKNFDFFEPGQEGLIGVTYENRSSSGFRWSVFGSGIYVPEMNPGLDINKSDNTITSRSAWGNPPARTTNIDGNETPIQYIVDYPKISDVIYRYSIGANIGWENKNWVSQAYFIRKPENNLSTNVEVALAEDAKSVKAFVKPEFYYHDVFGANLKYRNADVEMYVAGIAAFPNTFPDGNRDATTYTEIKTAKKRESYLGAGISRVNDKYGMGFNYIARVSSFDRETDSLAQDPRWNQAVNAFVMRNFYKKYNLMADIKYDTLTTDRLVMLRGGYRASKELLLTFGVNMIGTPNNGKSYWSPYTNNDSLYAGLRYIFKRFYGILKTVLFIASLLTLMVIGGCSDLFQKNVKDNSLESNKFKANCELNIDEFSLILEEDIREAIDCLGKNLKLFVKAVESKRPGYLSRIALENYIKRNRKDIKPEVLQALKSVFDINFLIYGEDPDFISEANIDSLIRFAKVFNDKASTNFKPIFMADEKVEYDTYNYQKEVRIKPAAKVISQGLREIFNQNRGEAVHQLDINNLLDSFTNINNESSMRDVRKLLFVKRILLGGDKNILTHKELGRLIDNFGSYVVLALDAIRAKDVDFNQESMVNFLNADVKLLNTLIFPSTQNRSNELMFTLTDVIDTFNLFKSDDSTFNLEDYYDLLKEAKLMVMEGISAEKVYGADLQRLFFHGIKLLDTGYYFHRFWAIEHETLEQKPGKPVTNDFKSLYSQFKTEKTRVDDFVRILKKYRFLKGSEDSAFYSDDYYRNANAVYEVAIYEYALTLVMKRFGCTVGMEGCDAIPTLGNVYMTKDQVTGLVNKFRKVLIDNGLIYPGREVKTAETITLLGSLFQYQSDENKVFDVNEATEFAVSLFTAIEVSDKVYERFEKLNRSGNCEMDNFESRRINPGCFKEHFFEYVCFNYPDQFPKLFESLGATVYEGDPTRAGARKLVCRIPQEAKNLAYLETAIRAARTCNIYPDTSEEIYYTKGDIMSIFLAMMHIETTILRWDTRIHNNVMDPAEVMDAYNIYSPALDGFMEDLPAPVKKLKKQIYQYLVKYEQIPDTKNFKSIWKFVKFLLSFNKNATANRKTIASILVTIGEQGAPSTFDCKLLHDPDNIPENYQGGPVETAPTEKVFVLAPDDAVLYRDIQSESDSKIKNFLDSLLPGFFSSWF